MFLGVLHGLGPGGGVVGALEIEATGVQKLVHRDISARGLYDHGVFLQAANNRLQLGHLLGCYRIGLVQDERRAELDLLDEQALDVVLVDVLLKQVAPAVELVVHTRAVHYGDDVVQVERRVPVVFRLVAEVGDDIRDRDGLADARRLDEDVVVFAGIRDVS